MVWLLFLYLRGLGGCVWNCCLRSTGWCGGRWGWACWPRRGLWLTVRTGWFQLTRLHLWLGQTLGAILRRSPDLAREGRGQHQPPAEPVHRAGGHHRHREHRGGGRSPHQRRAGGHLLDVGDGLFRDDDRLRRKPAGPALPAVPRGQLARRPHVLPFGGDGRFAPWPAGWPGAGGGLCPAVRAGLLRHRQPEPGERHRRQPGRRFRAAARPDGGGAGSGHCAGPAARDERGGLRRRQAGALHGRFLSGGDGAGGPDPRGRPAGGVREHFPGRVRPAGGRGRRGGLRHGRSGPVGVHAGQLFQRGGAGFLGHCQRPGLHTGARPGRGCGAFFRCSSPPSWSAP